MKKSYIKIAIAGIALTLSLSVLASIYDTSAGQSGTTAFPVEKIEGLEVRLQSPGVSGAEEIKLGTTGNHYEISDNVMTVALANLKQGTHRLTILSRFGTQVQVLYVADLVVAGNASADTTPKEDELIICETVGDGSGVQITVDQEVTENSENPVAGGAVYAALAGKQDAGNYADGSVYQTAENDVATVACNSMQVKRGNATLFEIDSDGNLVLYNAGVAVTLTPAKLAQLIA